MNDNIYQYNNIIANTMLDQQKYKQCNNPMENDNHIRFMSIQEEEAIQDILNQIPIQEQPELDIQLEQLINFQQKKLQIEYQKLADQRQLHNRQGINFQQDPSFMQAMHWSNYQSSARSSGSQLDKSFDYVKKVNQIQQKYDKIIQKEHNVIFDIEMPMSKPTGKYILDIFQQQQIQKSKLTDKQIIQLQSKYPKINHMSMLLHKYNIFQTVESSTYKWFDKNQISLDQIKAALVFLQNDTQWTVFAIKTRLIIFTKQNWTQPMIISPNRNKNFSCLAHSKCNKYIIAGLQDQILLYQIKNNSLILIKHLCDLQTGPIKHIRFYISSQNFIGTNTIKFYYVDSQDFVMLTQIQQTFIFTKVKTHPVDHPLQKLKDYDVIYWQGKTYMILAGTSSILLYTIQPQIKLIFQQKIEPINTINISVCWRYNQNLNKPQLFVAYDKKIKIFKLFLQSQHILGLHLQYHNHYQILQMEIISKTHLLIRSRQNIVIVAIPLIASTIQDENDNGQYQNAIVFLSYLKNCRILYQSSYKVLYFHTFQIKSKDSNQQQLQANQPQKQKQSQYSIEQIQQSYNKKPQRKFLNLSWLKTLEAEIDQLLIQKSLYRQAFILLILVFKQMNYSFKFSYKKQDLSKLISSSVQCTLSSFIVSMDKKILQYRIGWICQLVIECKQEDLLWSMVYPKLKQSSRQTILFQSLQIFLIKNQIKQIPEQILFEMVNYYSQSATNFNTTRDYVIQKMIVFNKQSYDPLKMLMLLHNRQMYYLQFYLFSKGIVSQDYDFYTPFLKVFSSFQNHYQNQRLGQYQKAAMICYWYLRKCFNFEAIPNGYMTLPQKTEVVFNLFLQLFSKTFLTKLSQYNLKLFLQVMLIPFTKKQFLNIIEEEQQRLIQKYNEFYYQTENQDSSKTNPTGSFVGKILNRLQMFVQSKSIYFIEFYTLVLFYTKLKIPQKKITDLLIILFENKIYQYSLYTVHNIEKPSVEQVKTYLVKELEPTLKSAKGKVFISKLISFEDKDVSYLLYKIDRSYKQALQHFYTQKQSEKLIPFVYQIINQINKLDKQQEQLLKQRKMLQVKEFLSKNINIIFKINRDEALQLFYKIGQTSSSIYNIVVNNMGSKLNFLTSLLERYSNQQFQNKQKYLLEHLQQVCSLPEHQMLNYISMFYYPLDSAILVSEQKGNYLAKAIFQQRSGQIQEAFKSYQKLIKSIIYNSHQNEVVVRQKVSKYIYQCIRICKQMGGDKVDWNIWIRIIQFINNFIKSNHQYKVYLKVQFQRLLQIVISEMIQTLPTQLLIQFFSKTDNQLQLSLSKQFLIFEKLFRMIKFDYLMIQKALAISKIHLKENRRSALISQRQGVCASNICDFCKSNLEDQSKSIVFWCSHSFHTFCHNDENKCLTCLYESDNSIIQNLIFKNKQKKSTNLIKSHSLNERRSKIDVDNIYVQTISQAVVQQRKKKMKIYDFQEQINYQKQINFLQEWIQKE